MKRYWIVMAVFCLICSGSLNVFGDEQKDQKDEYQKQTESKLTEFKQKLEELQVRAVDLKEDSKEQFNLKMEELKEKKAAAQKKLEKMKSASDEDWKKVKAEIDSALEDLNQRFNNIKHHFMKP